MWDEIAGIALAYFSSMLKFIFGPVNGYLAKLNMVTTILATVAGMMTVVFAFAFFGDLIRRRIIERYFGKRKLFSDRNRKFVVIWRKYGLLGVAALTPLLFTPIGGVLLAVGFGSPRDKLILYMFASASFWAVVLTFVVYVFGNNVLPDFMKP